MKKNWYEMTREEQEYTYNRADELIAAIREIDYSLEYEEMPEYTVNLYKELRERWVNEIEESEMDFDHVLWFYLPEDESPEDKNNPDIVVIYSLLGLEFRQ